ncbi:hypothetical protein QR98_0014510 [Sarcoptes scabiei]|uniref:Uncharacterized protein n=1 Tax=Sarcoptes scabiei TaxID=52283 RepID=A0A131ZW21_SARSC|nr:hypothetical protein QR98_0014510 [Sarcoptes scabiei]
MPDPRLKLSPLPIRLLKWLGLWTVVGSSFYIHYHWFPPEKFKNNKKMPVKESEMEKFRGFREESIKIAECVL